MTKANITQYSSTPSSNADINDINIAENCPASGLNNAIRELMAHLKNVDTGSQALTALSVTGVGSFGSLDISGNIDVDGTTNLDVVDIDGAVDMASDLIVSGRVGIGISNPSAYDDGADKLVVGSTSGRSGITIVSSTSNDGSINFADGTSGTARYMGFINYNQSTNTMKLATNAGTRLTIDNNGSVAIGTTTATGKLTVDGGFLQVQVGGTQAIRVGSTDHIVGGTDNDAVLQSNTGKNMRFLTGGTERMRISTNILIGTTDNSPAEGTGAGTRIGTNGGCQFSTSGIETARMNRTGDGNILVFAESGSVEGAIAVSGTTVSLNGGHLSRWSRLLDNSKDTSFVKGTVMTNLDEMVEWGDEDNEQLNKMAVSSVEGDANVAGVFVSWDNDDDWNDMNVAMTGDMVIRIAQGVTVARGDLLMSAGDGTAKTQDDDIVRSKTIAKVTSTNVSHTYDDGTYLVPCVLMAC